jgi:hypothetical protein
MFKMKKWHKSLLVIIGALVLSTVAIQASDIVRGIDGGLSGLVIESEGVCGNGAVQMLLGSHALCVDVFEASAGGSCPHANPQNQIETQENANSASCLPVTVAGAVPWRFVSYTQAQQFCARDGKRLPTNEEWYKIASGLTESETCAVDLKGDTPTQTGSTNCTTPSGVMDMVGNVWEWIDGQVTEGTYEGRVLPESGYVSLVDTDGVVIETKKSPSEEFGEDYALTDSQGVRGIIRGGFYKSGTDAGIFAQNLSVPLDLKVTGVGFRCLRDI